MSSGSSGIRRFLPSQKSLGVALAGLLAIYLVYLLLIGLVSGGSSRLYEPPQLPEQAGDGDRAEIVARALTYALDEELSSLFGWLPNDLFFVPVFIDNTTSYQRGVIYATRPASDILAKTAARFGRTDTIDKRLVDATSRFFTYSENVWGFWFVYDSEGKYRAGISSWLDWAKSVAAADKTKAVYNVKSDDIYDILKYCSNMLDYARGILNKESTSHFESDNNIYYTKGIAVVVTNVLRAVAAVDDSLSQRGGAENLEVALTRLKHVAEFNPVYVFAGGNETGDAMMPNHVAALARHLDVAHNRIQDMMQAMAR